MKQFEYKLYQINWNTTPVEVVEQELNNLAERFWRVIKIEDSSALTTFYLEREKI